MLSVGNKGPESLKTEIHLITEELPSLPGLEHVLGTTQSQVNIRIEEGREPGWSVLSPLSLSYLEIKI